MRGSSRTAQPAQPSAATDAAVMASHRRFLWKVRLVMLPGVVAIVLSVPVFLNAIASDPSSAMARWVQFVAALLIGTSKSVQVVLSFVSPNGAFMRHKDMLNLLEVNVFIPLAVLVQYTHPWPPDQAHHPLFEFLVVVLDLTLVEVSVRPAIFTILVQAPLYMLCDYHTRVTAGEITGPTGYFFHGAAFCLVAYFVPILLHLSVVRPKVAPAQQAVAAPEQPQDLARLAQAAQYRPPRGIAWARWLLLTQPTLFMVCYTVSKQIGALLRQRERDYLAWWLVPQPHSATCPSSPAEVTAALASAVVLTATFRWDVLYSLRQQLNSLRRVLLMILPSGVLEAIERSQAPRHRWSSNKLLVWALLVSYPVVVYSVSVHVVITFCKQCELPLMHKGDCPMGPMHVLVALVSSLMLGLVEQSSLLDELIRQLTLVKGVLRQVLPLQLAAFLEGLASGQDRLALED